MWYDASADCYTRPHPEGLLAVDGTEPVEADPERYDRDANNGFAASLAGRVHHRMPDCVPDVRRARGSARRHPTGTRWWANCETVSPSPPGSRAQEFMRSPAIGQRLAREIRGGEGIQVFDPLWFDGEETFEIREGMADRRRDPRPSPARVSVHAPWDPVRQATPQGPVRERQLPRVQ